MVPLHPLQEVAGGADELAQERLVADPALPLEPQPRRIRLLDQEGAIAADPAVLLAEERQDPARADERPELGHGRDLPRVRIGPVRRVDHRQRLGHPHLRPGEDVRAQPLVLGRRLPGHVAADPGDRPVQRVGDEPRLLLRVMPVAGRRPRTRRIPCSVSFPGPRFSRTNSRTSSIGRRPLALRAWRSQSAIAGLSFRCSARSRLRAWPPAADRLSGRRGEWPRRHGPRDFRPSGAPESDKAPRPARRERPRQLSASPLKNW